MGILDSIFKPASSTSSGSSSSGSSSSGSGGLLKPLSASFATKSQDTPSFGTNTFSSNGPSQKSSTSKFSIPAASKSNTKSIGQTLVGIGQSLVGNAGQGGLIKALPTAVNSAATWLQKLENHVNEESKPKAISTLQDPTKIKVVEMPTTGDQEKNDWYIQEYSKLATDYWVDKYFSDPNTDRDKAMQDLQQKINSAPTHNTEELLDRAELVAEYKFLEAQKNYDIYLGYDLNDGFAQIDQMDKQIEEWQEKLRYYEDAMANNNAASWADSDEQAEARRKASGMTEKEYQQMRADLGAMQQYRAALWNEVTDAQHEQLRQEYGKFSARDDYQTYVKKGSLESGNKRVENQGKSEGLWSKVFNTNSEAGLYDAMTKEEADMYDFLYGAFGEEEAERYFNEYLGKTLRMRRGAEQAGNVNEFFGDTWYGDLGQGLYTTYLGGQSAVKGAFGDVWSTIKGGATGHKEERQNSVDDYAYTNLRQQMNEMDSGIYDYKLLGRSFPEYVADATSSGGRMAPMLMTSAILGKFGVPTDLSKVISGAVMTAGIYSATKDEMTRLGYNEKSAETYAMLTAASETAVGAMLGGYEAIGGAMGMPAVQNFLQNIDNASLRFALTMGVKMDAEGKEEYIQDVIDPVFRNIAFGESNDIHIISEEGAYSYLVAAISVFGTESMSTWTDVAQCDAAGAYVNAVRGVNPELYEELLKTALESDNEDISELAEKIQSGEYKANNGNLGQLLIEMAKTRSKNGKWSNLREAAQSFIKESAEHLAEMKFEDFAEKTQNAAQQEWEQLAVNNPDKVLLSPVASELRSKTGWDIETVQEQAAIIAKIISGITPTRAEVNTLDVNNKHVLDLIERYSGVKIDGTRDRAFIRNELIKVAMNATYTEDLQKALAASNDSFLAQRFNELANDEEFTGRIERMGIGARAGTNLEIAKKPGMRERTRAPFSTPAAKTETGTTASADTRAATSETAPAADSGVETVTVPGGKTYQKEGFIQAYMQQNKVDRATAEGEWNRLVAVAGSMNGGNANGQQVRGGTEGRVTDVAGREGTSAVHGGETGSGEGAATGSNGTVAEDNKAKSWPKLRLKGSVIAETDYTPEQAELAQRLKDDGFKEVTLVDGLIYNKQGQRINAQASGDRVILATKDSKGNPISAENLQRVAKHERVHLWLSALLGPDRSAFVRKTVDAILPQRIRDNMFDAYAKVYAKAYPNLAQIGVAPEKIDAVKLEQFVDIVYEEMLADMFGGMNNYGLNAFAANYQDAATRAIEKAGIRGNFLRNGIATEKAQTSQQTSQVETTATEQTTQETKAETGPPENDGRPNLNDLLAEEDYAGDTEELAEIQKSEQPATDEETPNPREGLSIEEKVALDIDWEDEGNDLPTEPNGDYWMDDEYYSVSPDTPKKTPDFLDPYKADTNVNTPPDVRTFPGEPPMHDNLGRFSISALVEGTGFELKLNSAGYPYQVIDKATGKPVTEVTAEMMHDTPMGDLIEMGREINPNIDSEGQYQMMADLMNLVLKYDDAAMVWEIAGSQLFSAIKANSDKQYNRTIDFSTICKKTQAIVDAMSQTMIRLNRGLTRREVEAVYLKTGEAGESTPCPVCYVFSRWMGIGNLLGQINTFQNKFFDYDASTGKYTSKGNIEEYIPFMEEVEQEARAFAEDKIANATNPEKTRALYFDKDTGEFKIGKAISNMKPNSAATGAIKKLSAHQQATARIAEINKLMETATPAEKTKYQSMIKELKKLSLVTYNRDGSVKNDKKLREAQAALEEANRGIQRYELYQWLSSTMLMRGQKTENGRPVFDENGEAVNTWVVNPKFKPVPPEVLFDLNRGGDFAKDYPLTWAFRTGKGCAMGKAITPYSDARVGETIQGVAGDINKIRVGEQNEFLNGDARKRRQTLESARKKQRQQNLIGGMRYQSTSDFRYEYGSDYLMTFFEMQALGANVQLYTKVIEAVDFLASTGADCNLSLMPLSDGYRINPETGKKELIFSDVTGINHEAAFKKVRQYDNVQCILVGINDTNILLALESEDVTFVIPFHGSGQSVHQVQTLMNLLGEDLNVMEAQDYTKVQSDHEIPNRAKDHPELQAMWDLRLDIIKGNLLNGVTAEQQALLNKNPHLQKLYNMFYVEGTDPLVYQNFLGSEQAKQIFPYEYWDKTSTYENADINGESFKSYCESMGIIPRFSGMDSSGKEMGFGNFAYGGENGKSVKGYWKLLIDRKMYSNTYDEAGNWTGYGAYREQQQIDMSNVKLSDLDPATGAAQFTKGEMSKAINPEKTESIVEKSIRDIEIINETGDIYDHTALNKGARDILTRTELNHQPTSEELLHQKMDEMGVERYSVAGETEETTDVSGPISSWTDEDISGITKGLNFRDADGTLLERVFDGTKKYETRDYTDKQGNGKLAPAYLNKPMGIIQTGNGRAKLVGFWELGDGMLIERGGEWYEKHKAELGIEGTEFDNGTWEKKWIYPIKYAGRTQPTEVTSFGQSARSISDLTQRGTEILGRNSIASDTDLTETQQKNYDYNSKQTETGSPLKTLQGTTIKRYQNNVGKEVSPQIYVHKNYAAEVIPQDALAKAEAVLQEKYPDFTYNTLMYDKKTGNIRFDEAPDFDTAREPIAGHTVTVTPDGLTKTGYSDSIWHHKWLWVGNDYTGFNVDDSWNWSKQWLSTIRPVDASVHKFNSSFSQKGIANGTGHGTTNWNEQLNYFGLPHDENVTTESVERYSVALDNPVFDSDQRQEPVTDDYGSTFYIQPTDSWEILRDENDNLMNTKYMKDVKGFDIFDNPLDPLNTSAQRTERVWNGSKMKGHKTQKTTETVATYQKVGDELIAVFGEDRAKKLRILDASSGTGFGTSALLDRGFDVTDLEPFPPPGGAYVPNYRNYGDLLGAIENGTEAPFDIVISNAVINVMAQDARAEIVAALGKFAATDGHIFLNTFDAKQPSDKAPNKVIQPATGKIGRETYTVSTSTIQKGFTPDELKGFIRDVLTQTGETGFSFSPSDVAGVKNVGGRSLWIDMDGRTIEQQAKETTNRYSIASDADYQSAVDSGDVETAQQMVDAKAQEAGYTKQAFHGTTSQFWTFARGKEGIHFGDIQQAQDTLEKDQKRNKTTEQPLNEVLSNLESYNPDQLRDISQSIEMLHMDPDLKFDGTFPSTPNNYDDTSPKDIRRYAKRVLSKYHGDKTVSIIAPNLAMKNRMIEAYIKQGNVLHIPVDLGNWSPRRVVDVLLAKLDGQDSGMLNANGEMMYQYKNRERDTIESGYWDPREIEGIELTGDDRVELNRIFGTNNWEQLAAFLHKKGVDSIEYTNMYEGEEDAPSYLLLDPEQVKLADPVTYDDDGKVIPLSERFNSESNDMRYSVADVETLDKEYNKALAANDPDWQAMLVNQAGYLAGYTVGAYHGSPVTDITEFRTRSTETKPQKMQLLFGTHFTQNKAYADIYARKAKNSKGTSRMTYKGNGRVYDVLLDLGKSLDLRTARNYAPGSEMYDLYEDMPDSVKRKVKPREFTAADTAAGLGEGKFITASQIEECLQRLSPAEATQILVDHGYNSVLYNAEYGTVVRNAMTRDPSIIMLDPNRIKSAEPITFDDDGKMIPLSERFNSESNDMRYSLTGSEQDMYDLLKAEGPEAVENWVNNQLEKAEAGKAQRSAKPVIPAADKVIPVGEVERKVQLNQLDALIEKYGRLKQGEKPSRDVALPRKTSRDQYVRRFIQNVAEAPNTRERTVENLERAVVTHSDIANYARISDAKANSAADRYYNTYGYGAMLDEWNRLVNSNNRVTKYDIAKGERLLIEADMQGDNQAVMKLVADLAAMGTAAGQTVQAMRLLKKMGPIGQLYYFQKAVDRLNKKYEGRITRGTMVPIHINQELAEKVLLAQTQEEIDKAMDNLKVDTAKQLPVGLADKWNGWRYFAMLFNPRTHIRNWLGNDFFRPLRFTKDLLASAGESIFIKDRSQRTKSADYLLSGGRYSSKYKDLTNFAISDFKVMQKDIQGTGKMNTVNQLMEARELFKGPLGKLINKGMKFNGDLLEGADAFYLKRAYVNALAEYMAAQGLTVEDISTDSKALNQARQYAVLEAQKATYRDYCGLANALNSLRNKDSWAAKVLMDGIMPFTKTPTNILRRGIEYSPIGLLTSVTFGLNQVRKGDLTAAEAIDHIAAGMTGTGIALLGAFLASMGIARGADDDDKKKAEIERAQGHQEYSLEIGDESFTIDWLAPVSLPFFVGVEAFKHISEGGPLDFYDVADLTTLIAEPMLSLSMLDGVNQVLTAASYGDNNALQAVLTQVGTSYLSQGLPTLGAQIARTIDPYRRATYVDKGSKQPGWMQNFIQQSMGKIPGVASEKMAYVDMWGRKQTSGSLGMRAFENFIFPFYMKNINENPVEHELLRLVETTGDNEMIPATLAKTFTSDGQKLNLNAQQYEQLKTINGRNALQTLGELMLTPAYNEMDDEQKVAAIKNALTVTTSVGRLTVDENYKPAAWVQRAIEYDNWQDAVMFHTFQQMDTGLSNYQLIECMYWLHPEEQGKLITAQYTPQKLMTDYTQKKFKFELDDDMKARSREIYEQMFWVEYPKLYSSQAFTQANIRVRAEMVKDLVTDVGKAARSAYGDELRAQGVQSFYSDDPMQEEEEIAAFLNEFGYEE